MRLEELRGVGKNRLEALHAAKIYSICDLLSFLPADYKDTTSTVPMCSLHPGRPCCVEGTVLDTPKTHYIKKMSMVRCAVSDGEGKLYLTWFNQPWVGKQIHKGDTLMLFGRPQKKNGAWSMANPERVAERAILPVYRVPAGIPAKTFADLIRQSRCEIASALQETLPERVIAEYALMGRAEAVMQAHFPDNKERLGAAQRRIGFENLLLYQMAIRLLGGGSRLGLRFSINERDKSAFRRAMPFALTRAQENVLEDVERDLTSGRMMNRLVQGDVGSGKTVIALAAAYYAARSGFQCALMAPTEVLARQHAETAKKLLEPLQIKCGLLTGGMRALERREALVQLASGAWQVAIGTHALISRGVEYQSLGMVITDEQHRFGVRQRRLLQEKGGEDAPHVLVMSATPIPRTLSLILYGDLDVSVIGELPPGRTPVITRVVPESKRAQMYGFIRTAVERGEQAYFVCPLVEESEAAEGKNAVAMYEELRSGALKGLEVGLTYGSQPAEEKADVLSRFASGKVQVLVATTVIEVGIDVPNATMIVIEDAERFGLSQLHQLRGRVGRGGKQSWCFLVGESNERLRTMCDTGDGFVIAQKDLELRGPGEFLGTRQHGHIAPDAFGVSDMMLVEETRACAERVMREEGADREMLIASALSKYEERLKGAVLN